MTTILRSDAVPQMRIPVDYYDDSHKVLLQKHSHAKQIEDLVRNGISIDANELVTHMLFTEQKNYDGFRTYNDLKTMLPEQIKQFQRYFELTGSTLQAKFPPDDMNNWTERVGVAGALVVMNKIFGLHEADWEKLPISRKGKALDFSLLDRSQNLDGATASTGSKFIEVEGKGAVVESGRIHFRSPVDSEPTKQRHSSIVG